MTCQKKKICSFLFFIRLCGYFFLLFFYLRFFSSFFVVFYSNLMVCKDAEKNNLNIKRRSWSKTKIKNQILCVGIKLYTIFGLKVYQIQSKETTNRDKSECVCICTCKKKERIFDERMVNADLITNHIHLHLKNCHFFFFLYFHLILFSLFSSLSAFRQIHFNREDYKI